MKSVQWTLWVTILFTYILSETLSIPIGNESTIEILEDDKVIKTIRVKRDPRAHSRGQTQSQYLNFGNPEHDGKAEAEATEKGSRSFVTGTHGMGQAQSQFSGGDCTSCTGCACEGYETPEPLKAGTDTYGRQLRPEELSKPYILTRKPAYIQIPSIVKPGSIRSEQAKPAISGADIRRPEQAGAQDYTQPGFKQPSSAGYMQLNQPPPPVADEQISGHRGIPSYGQQPAQRRVSDSTVQKPDYSISSDNGRPGVRQPSSTVQPELIRQQRPHTGLPVLDTQRPGYHVGPTYGQPDYKLSPDNIQPALANSQPGLSVSATQGPGYSGGPIYEKPAYKQPPSITKPILIQPQRVQPGILASSTQEPRYPGYAQPDVRHTPGITQTGLIRPQQIQPGLSVSATQGHVYPGYVQPDYRHTPGTTQTGLIHPQQIQPGLSVSDTRGPGYPDYAQPDYRHVPGTTQSVLVHPQQVQTGLSGSITQEPGYPGGPIYGKPGYNYPPGTTKPRLIHPYQLHSASPTLATQEPGYPGGPIHDKPVYTKVPSIIQQELVHPQQLQLGLAGSIAQEAYHPNFTSSVSEAQLPCQARKTQAVTKSGRDKECGSLTILVGTGGPRQTVITNGQLSKDTTLVHSGYSPMQTDYGSGGSLTLLVGTDGPTQSVYDEVSPGLRPSYSQPGITQPMDPRITTSITNSPNSNQIDSTRISSVEPTKLDQLGPNKTRLDRVHSDLVDTSELAGSRPDSGYYPTDFVNSKEEPTNGKVDFTGPANYSLQNAVSPGISPGMNSLKFGFASHGTIWPDITRKADYSYSAPSYTSPTGTNYDKVRADNQLGDIATAAIWPTQTKSKSTYPGRDVIEPDIRLQSHVRHPVQNQDASLIPSTSGEIPTHISTSGFITSVGIPDNIQHTVSTKTDSLPNDLMPSGGQTSHWTDQIGISPSHSTTPGFAPTGTGRIFGSIPTQTNGIRHHIPSTGQITPVDASSSRGLPDSVSVYPVGTYQKTGLLTTGTHSTLGYPSFETSLAPRGPTTGMYVPSNEAAGPQALPRYDAITSVGVIPNSVSSNSGSVGCNGGCPSVITPTGHRTGEIGSLGQNIFGGQSAPILVDDSFSQAESLVQNGHAKASAQGKKAGGTAQTQVSGTYTGSGSFSANAMTSDNERAANAQVSGSSDGALSQAQGTGGMGKSQSQVQINSKTGGTTSQSQSSGHAHQSQSEVQANERGGLADAQSSGPGQTSSQAQIGFKPQKDELQNNNPVFNGGGEASAQSGSYSGQSQSQIHGKFKYGISYQGAAQAASGTKEQVASYRERNKVLFQTISELGSSPSTVTEKANAVYGPSSSIPSLGNPYSGTDIRLRKGSNNEVLNKENGIPNEDADYEEEEEIEYDEDEDELDYSQDPLKLEPKTGKIDYGDKNLERGDVIHSHMINETKSSDQTTEPNNLNKSRTFAQNSASQSQQASILDDITNNYSLVQKQNGHAVRYSPNRTTEKVPDGFRATVNLEKKHHTRNLQSKHSQGQNISNKESVKIPDTYVTVTKSVTGSFDTSKNPPSEKQNFSSTYYTKSSTCGYFTFSCNIVYGTNGRSKICRPKKPTNGKC